MAQKNARQQRMGAMELFGVLGFSFFFGYYLLTFFWLFLDFPQNVSNQERSLVQLFVFLGISAVFGGVSLLKRKLAASRAQGFLRLFALVFAIVLPLEVFLGSLGITLPVALNCIGSVMAGIAGGLFLLEWLSATGSARVRRYLVFTSSSIAGGAILFFLVYLVLPVAQPLFALAYLGISFALMQFLRLRTDQQSDFTLKARREFLPFVREIEPAIFTYGVVFGLGFALLFINGQGPVLWGMCAILVGALVMLLLALFGFSITITAVQRAILVVVVAACLAASFTSGWAYTLSLCLIAASWAVLSATNWAILVQRSITQKSIVFFSVSSGGLVATLGFLLGWLVMLLLSRFGVWETVQLPVMLFFAFVLVAVVMLFLPQQHHHDESSVARSTRGANEFDRATFAGSTDTHAGSTGSAGSASDGQLTVRIEAITKLYGLSVRERTVLSYLVRGRNASYIQKELVISPHTAKSHIYNIYRKLDIHSQQRLMDFVEEFPLKNS